MIREGSRVQYAGDDPFNTPGAQGKVLLISGAAAHVQWATGPKTGKVDLVEQFELIERGQAVEATLVAETFDNSLGIATPVLQVRAAYDEGGEPALVAALEEAGKISVLAEYAEEAGSMLAARIRTDQGFSQVLSHLDADEATSLVTRVAALVLSDWISGEQE